MILVDPAVWAWRGRRWAHLVSDRDYAELHDFAAGLGLARVAFQGDHYDVDEDTRRAALAAGAEPVDARELLRRLRQAGLRRPAATQALAVAGAGRVAPGSRGSTRPRLAASRRWSFSPPAWPSWCRSGPRQPDRATGRCGS